MVVVVVAGKARFGGGEGQQPREKQSGSLLVRSLCVCVKATIARGAWWVTVRQNRVFAARRDDNDTALFGHVRAQVRGRTQRLTEVVRPVLSPWPSTRKVSSEVCCR